MTDSIKVWRISPLRRVGDVASLRAILPPDELARSERQVDEAKRRAWITSRAVLRLLLAHYTHIPANEIRLVPGRNGKPYLESSQNPSGITFNFSDSGDMALVAVSWNREVGVDVEQVRTIQRATEIAARRFSTEISAEISRTPGSDKDRVFLQNWARHEALLKARAGTIWNQGTEGTFTVRDLDTGLGYVGALAAEGDGWSLEVRDYSD